MATNNQQNHGKNYHKEACPWHGVNLDDDDQCDQMDETPCVCTYADFDAAIMKDMEQHKRAPLTPGFHKLGPSAQQAATSRAKAFYPFD